MAVSWHLNVEIDRSTNLFNVAIGYYIEPYIEYYPDPDFSEYTFGDTMWGMNYFRGGDQLLGSWNGFGSASEQVLVALGLEAGPGLKTYTLDFGASNLVSFEAISATWYVLSVAYDTTPQMVVGTATDDVIIGGSASDVLRGFYGSDLIDAGDGNDIVEGGDGSDRLDGGNGDDILIGGTGDDTITVDATGDMVIEHADEGTDRVIAFASVALADNVEELFLSADPSGTGDADLSGTGNAADNLIWGNNGANTLSGLDGHDTLQGHGGDDVLRGGASADTLDGSVGIDTASYYTGSEGVSVNLALGNGFGIGGDAQGDVLIEIEILSGSQGHDSLTGNAGANVLQGWNGNDAVIGKAGKDTLTGGAGADHFVYTSAAESAVGANADRVTDFSHAQGDKIDLSAIDASTALAGNQAFSFIGTALYGGIAGQLRYASDGAVTTIAGDVNGDGTSDFHIRLTGAIGLEAGDFIL